jgi:sarcosine oxidase/L-pipecolate oxidase
VSRVVIVGAGAFGLATARELVARGHDVTVVERGRAPHSEAASTDMSKLVRGDYGVDGLYTDLMERAWPRWHGANERWRRELGRELCHETGFLVLSSEGFAQGGFEHDSFATLEARGYPLERLRGDELVRRFAALGAGRFVEGYVNPRAGWVESGAVIAAELRSLRQERCRIVEDFRLASLERRGGRVVGVRASDGALVEGDAVVLAAGSWLPSLMPELARLVRPSGHPVVVLRPTTSAPFVVPTLLPWAADIGRTGWYGFAANADGLVKVANHGVGVSHEPEAPRVVPESAVERARSFLRGAVPALADAAVATTRLCFYADSFDGDFLIARHPDEPGLVVATGDSGHAFKFYPVLGELVADALLGLDNPFLARFAWRDAGPPRAEQARCRE